ncbi:16S rRNA (cytosine(1402)-N(4))-methyltransferase RsmH [Paracrocinitomix mangrovi]|uniref:16S rRNA (cytosine(1402)-N(4))-methyltransferase RsmH n=1 Tax=Paracrocinitomix mangrovi TaxID=2862509 RepID=UPI001ED9CD40|nr:16S rRNA (cytosine(1402)-N(4))-methyltransferase RsmH [Paracrocinitomix mangrovi]UKN03354.1 16S rRNA (cytosine(1402)-N(4))-methyltransferase RsmH [Paracrocinitomix mangrovi]
MLNSEYHVPVLFNESIESLDIKSDSVVVDVTFGGGGHSKEILKSLGNEGVLVAFDQDEDAIQNVVDDSRLIFVEANFRFLYNFIKFYDLLGVDGILADLGVSSHQFDVGERGFSIRENGALDMRMNQESRLTAAKVVNDYPEAELYRIFNAYADLKNVKRVVTTIVSERKKNKVETTGELVKMLENLVPPKKKNQFLAQVFQAIRIEVNDEMGALMEMLEQSVKVLKPGGKLVVISYHSIEDRLVKNFIRAGNFEGKVETDVFGVANVPLKAITKKPIIPTAEEIERNPRSRSAKLRVAVRT